MKVSEQTAESCQSEVGRRVSWGREPESYHERGGELGMKRDTSVGCRKRCNVELKNEMHGRTIKLGDKRLKVELDKID